jgi:hypothetical protein
MAYPRVEDTSADWDRRGAVFYRTTLGQRWELHVPYDGYVTLAQAALLLELHHTLLWDWVRRGMMEAFDQDGTMVVRLIDVRAEWDRRYRAGQYRR